MMMRPRFFRGAKRAERGPMMIFGVLVLSKRSKVSRRAFSVCFEWIFTTFSPKVCSKICTSWEVRAISGTSRMVDKFAL